MAVRGTFEQSLDRHLPPGTDKTDLSVARDRERTVLDLKEGRFVFRFHTGGIVVVNAEDFGLAVVLCEYSGARGLALHAQDPQAATVVSRVHARGLGTALGIPLASPDL